MESANQKYYSTKMMPDNFYNYYHNILRLFGVLPNFHFTTTGTMRYYYLQTWYIPVASRVVKRLKTKDLSKFGNIRKESKLHKMIA